MRQFKAQLAWVLFLVAALITSILVSKAYALDDGLARTPPMGCSAEAGHGATQDEIEIVLPVGSAIGPRRVGVRILSSLTLENRR